MLLKLSCLEPLAAICCGAAAASIHALDGGLAAGAVIGGVGLIARFKDSARLAGLDQPRLMERMQITILRELDRFDSTAEQRDALTLADAAMRRSLLQVMLTRDELARTASATGSEPYPGFAARLITDRLARIEPMFGLGLDTIEGLPRRFARTVIERALSTALEDADYRDRLSMDFLINMSGELATIREEGRTGHKTTHALLNELMRGLSLGSIENVKREIASGALTLEQVRSLSKSVHKHIKSLDSGVEEAEKFVDSFLMLIKSDDEADRSFAVEALASDPTLVHRGFLTYIADVARVSATRAVALARLASRTDRGLSKSALELATRLDPENIDAWMDLRLHYWDAEKAGDCYRHALDAAIVHRRSIKDVIWIAHALKDMGFTSGNESFIVYAAETVDSLGYGDYSAYDADMLYEISDIFCIYAQLFDFDDPERAAKLDLAQLANNNRRGKRAETWGGGHTSFIKKLRKKPVPRAAKSSTPPSSSLPVRPGGRVPGADLPKPE